MFSFKVMKKIIYQNKFFLAPFFLLIILGLCLIFLKPVLQADQGLLQIDAYIDNSVTANIWVNDPNRPPETAKLGANLRNRYKFKVGASEINYLRLDPAPGLTGINFRIYGIEIQSPSGLVQKISPKEIAGWQVMNFQQKSLTDEYVEFTSGQNLILVTNSKYLIELKYPRFIHKTDKFLSEVGSITTILIIFFVLIILLSAIKKSWAPTIIFSSTYFVLIALARYLADLNFGVVSVDKVIGLAAFSGRSLAPNMIFLWVSVLISLMIPATVYVGRKKLGESQRLGNIENTRLNKKYFWCMAMLILLWFFPNMLHGVTRHAIVWNGMYVPHWDSDNAVTWAYMIQNGMRPFRDFWYPYGFSFLFDLLPPWGAILQYGVVVGAFLLFFFLLQKILIGSAYLPIALTFFVLMGGLPNEQFMLFPQPERHLFPFLICFSYLYGCLSHKSSSIYYFWVITCLGLLIEPSQVAYSALGIGMVLAINIYQNLNLKFIAKKMLREFLVPTVFLGAMSICIYISGYGKNVSEFYLSMGDVARYMAIPTRLDIGYLKFSSKDNFLIIIPFLLMGLGFYEATATKKKNAELGMAVMMCGTIGVMMLQKHLVRPIDWALFYSSSIGIILYGYLILNKIKIKIGVIFGSLSSLILIVLIGSGVIFEAQKRLLTSYKNLREVLDAVVSNDNSKKQKLNVFSAEYLKAYSQEMELIRVLRGSNHSVPKFYSLPDDPMLYVIADISPPYQINGFNLSPIYEQEKIISYLEGENIEYVILDPIKGYIDGIPYYIRLPILYKFILKNYDLFLEVNRFKVLRRKISKSPINLKIYSDIFGRNVDLGSIPSYSQPRIPANSSECNGKNQCDLIIEVKSFDTKNNKITIPINIENIKFNIIFNKSNSNSNYFINLNRIWFFNGEELNIGLIRENINDPNIIIKSFYSKKIYPEFLY